MKRAALDLPPLWRVPEPFVPTQRHNGGPPLEPRRPGRPSISTPDLRDRILDLLGDGTPLAVICRAGGMPCRGTVRAWRRADPEFDRQYRFASECGCEHLADLVFREVNLLIDEAGPKVARQAFNQRRHQLARINPRFFGGP